MTAILFLAGMTVVAQSHCWVKYKYDAAGNRIKRYWWCGDPNEIEKEEEVKTKSAMAEDFGLRLYPNPASDAVQLSSTSDMANAQLEVLDLQGRRVHSERVAGMLVSIDVSSWSAGRYTLVLRREQEEYTTSFSVAP
ncbi:MAG: T9SS type A sorting domain-containing protein [Flavobacteriales bacterium]|nr:MAG: T9SS type A sorting domain-containing protein [Flavobacteriales bacterium]